jgi:hypothetical protein
VSENRELMGTFGTERENVRAGWKNYIMSNFIMSVLHKILLA